METVIFPGSFDPVTLGHLDLLERSSRLASKVIVAVAKNSTKKTLLTLQERCALLERSTASMKKIEIIPFSGLLSDFATTHHAQALIRGIRGAVDADHEVKLSQISKSLNPKLETILLVANGALSFISSTVVKEVFKHGGDITHLAPECVKLALHKKFKNSDTQHK